MRLHRPSSPAGDEVVCVNVDLILVIEEGVQKEGFCEPAYDIAGVQEEVVVRVKEEVRDLEDAR